MTDIKHGDSVWIIAIIRIMAITSDFSGHNHKIALSR